MQNGLFPVDHQCMTGIVSALKPDHGGDTFSQQIDDLALALVAPLCTDDYNILTHNDRL